MADAKKNQQAAEQEELADVMAEAAELREQQEVEGGKYLAEDGKTFVDANGEPLKDKK
jgi:hypothetical protein